MTRFIHLTDLHISHPDLEDSHLQSDTTATLERVVAALNGMDQQPDFIAVSGDLTNHGDEQSYVLVRDLLEPLKAPVVLALGNHDKRAGFNAVFSDGMEDTPFFHDSLQGDLHVITLDSAVPGRIAGALDDAQFDYLEQAFTRHPEVPKIIMVHHPPRLDPDELAWASLDQGSTDRLAETLKGQNVVAILTGHIHVNRVAHWNGIPVIVANGQHSTVDQMRPDVMRVMEGTGFAICDYRASGLTVSFVPLSPGSREIAVVDGDRVRTFR